MLLMHLLSFYLINYVKYLKQIKKVINKKEQTSRRINIYLETGWKLDFCLTMFQTVWAKQILFDELLLSETVEIFIAKY